jgi:hypothetical protein
MSLGIGVQGIQVLAVAGRAGPFGGRFDGGSLPPLAESGDELPLDAGGDHVAHVLVPAAEVASQSDGITLQPESRADGVAHISLLVCGFGGAILVPAIGLAGATGIAREDLEDDVGADGVGLLPAIGHATGIPAIGIDEDDELAVDTQEVGVLAIMIADVGKVSLDLGGGGVALALVLVVDSPAESRAGGGAEEAVDLGIGLGALAPPGGDGSIDVAILHHVDMLLEDILVPGAVEAKRGSVVGIGVDALLGPGFFEPGVIERRPDGKAGLPISVVGRVGVAFGDQRQIDLHCRVCR